MGVCAAPAADAGELAGADWVTPTGVVNTDWPAQNVQGNKIAKKNFGRMISRNSLDSDQFDKRQHNPGVVLLPWMKHKNEVGVSG
jgi:hypothetical protein